MRIILSNNITLLDIPIVLQEQLVSELKFINPVYQSAIDQGKSVYKVNKFICNFEIPTDNIMIVPKGMRQKVIDLCSLYNVPFTIEDNRNITYIETTKGFQINFRPYQKKAIEAITKSASEGVLVSMAGSGKTVMGLSLIPIFQQKTLWLTHTDRLLKQTKERSEAFLSLEDEEIGIIQGDKKEIGTILTIGMVQTLAKSPKILNQLRNEFGLVIIDECLVAGTKILMDDGSYKLIENVENGDKTTFGKVSNKFMRTTDSIVKLRTSENELIGTPTHKLLTIPKSALKKGTWLNGTSNQFEPFSESDVIFSEMKDIQEEDFLLVKEQYNHTEKFSVGKERSRLLSLIACDGHIDKNLNCLQIGVIKDKDWFLKELWYNTLIYKNHDIRLSDCKRGDLIIRSYSEDAINDMNKFIPSGKKSYSIKVPEMIMNGTYEDIKNYLQVAFDCKGSITDQISLTMANKEFVKDLQFLLHKFGISSRLIPINKHKHHFRIAMSGYDLAVFYEKIGFSIERKQTALRKILNETGAFRRLVQYRNKQYRCVEVLEKNLENKTTNVYDFTTEEHLFIANGMLSSNCHHCPSSTFTKILKELNSYYTYGLTATAYRRDGLENMLFQNVGPILHEVDKADIMAAGGIILPSVKCKHLNVTPSINSVNIPKILSNFITHNVQRNKIICDDVIREAEQGRTCIVVSTSREHCEVLFSILKERWDKTSIATGKYSKKIIDATVKEFEDQEKTVLVTTSHLLGEGFDVSLLDRLFLTVSIRSESIIEQLAGRIQRYHPNKKDAVIYDYIDESIGIFKNQYISKGKCRFGVYKKLGLKLHHEHI